MRILYLHGFASGPSSKKARFFRERFAARGVALEVPPLDGGDFENLTISGQLRVVEDLARGEPVSLMGSSMGGYLAALYAVRQAEVRRVVLMAPAFGFTRRWPEALGAQRVEEWRRTGRMEVFHYGEQRPRSLGYALLEDGGSYEDYPDFRQPALIFHGRLDDVVPADFSRDFARTHPNVDLEVLESGHELGDVLERMWERTRPFLMEGS